MCTCTYRKVTFFYVCDKFMRIKFVKMGLSIDSCDCYFYFLYACLLFRVALEVVAASVELQGGSCSPSHSLIHHCVV